MLRSYGGAPQSWSKKFDSSRDNSKWREKHIAMLDEFKAPLDFKPYKGACRGLPSSHRMREHLQIAWASVTGDRLPQIPFDDVSQCVSRKTWGTLGTITTKGLIFDYARGRVAGLCIVP